MKTIDYGTMSTTVDRENNQIYIKTIFNSKMCEIMAECTLDVFTLKIENATSCETYNLYEWALGTVCHVKFTLSPSGITLIIFGVITLYSPSLM